MKTNKFLILLLILSFGLNAISQTQFTVTYSRTDEAGGIDDIQTLSYKDNIGMFNFFQKETRRKIKFYTINLPFRKYITLYNIKSKDVVEQNQLKNGSLVLAKWKDNTKWKILEDTKVINGYNVQKATTQSYSSNSATGFEKITAWFTTEIPVGIGPNRYNGLPGLILELSPEKFEKTYKMIKIDFEKAVTIPKLNKGITVTKEKSLRPHTITKKFLKSQKKTNLGGK